MPRLLLLGSALVESLLLLSVLGCSRAAPPQPEPTVAVRDIPGVGRVLVDMDGSTLYVSDSERAGLVRCTDECAARWPPLTVPPGATLTPGEGLAGPLATVNRADGRIQVTYAGRPLYLYSLDTGPDMTKGNGLVDESGTTRTTWRVAALTGFAV